MTHPFISDWGCIQGRIVPKPGFGFPGTLHYAVLSYYGCQVAKLVISRRLMALRIPMSVQLLQKNELASFSRQSFILFITRRNLAQYWCTVSLGSCRIWDRSLMFGWAGGFKSGTSPDLRLRGQEISESGGCSASEQQTGRGIRFSEFRSPNPKRSLPGQAEARRNSTSLLGQIPPGYAQDKGLPRGRRNFILLQ